MSLRVSNFVCEFQRRPILYKRPLIGCGRLLERRLLPRTGYLPMITTTVSVAPRPSAEDFYKKTVLCSAHVVGIADPVKYRKRPEAVEVFKRQQEVWSVHLSSDRSSLTQILQDAGNVTIADADPAMYGQAPRPALVEDRSSYGHHNHRIRSSKTVSTFCHFHPAQSRRSFHSDLFKFTAIFSRRSFHGDLFTVIFSR